MMRDGKILYMEAGAIVGLRTEGHVRNDSLPTGGAFRDIAGLDNRVWQHLLDCAERVAEIEAALQITWAEPDPKPAAHVQTEPKTRPVCGKCGSDDVRADAYAAWSMDAQEWELTATFDKGAVCEDCGGECSLEWVEEGADDDSA